MFYLTRRETFNAAHKLSRPDWSDEKNRATFGKCANKNWHGHNYELFVTVAGDPHPDTGFVMDAKRLSDIVNDLIIEDVDHSNFNLDVPWMPEGKQPTTEIIAGAIWDRLEQPLQEGGARLFRVRVQETENIWSDYYGPQGHPADVV